MLQACPQPDVLRPERATEDHHLPDPYDLVFGFGRRLEPVLVPLFEYSPQTDCAIATRICPGRYLVDYSIWYLIANITATFDIRRCLDKDGKEIVPPFSVTQDFVR